MNKPYKSNRAIEDQLANFTDSMLDNTEENTDRSSPDPELLALQQTVLHLKTALPGEGPSEAVIHRMRQQVVQQWKQEENKISEPFWRRLLSVRRPSGQKWQPQSVRQRKTLLIYLAVVILVLVSLPFINKTGLAQPATSGQTLNVFVFIALGSLVLLALLFFRRKR